MRSAPHHLRNALLTRVVSGTAALALGLGLSGCGQESVDLAGRSFTSTDVYGYDLVAGSEVTLAFEADSLAARAGCNTIAGGVSTEDGTLEFDSQAASTMMACDPALMAQDVWLTELLTSSPSLTLEGDTLTVGDDTNGMVLTQDGGS